MNQKVNIENLFWLFAITSFFSFAPDSAPATLVVLRAGTPISLELNEDIDPFEIAVGNILDFTVRNNVMVNGKVLIATGASAEGRLKKIRGNHRMAELTLIVDTAQAVDGQRVFLRSRPQVTLVKIHPKKSSTLGTKVSARVLNDLKINA